MINDASSVEDGTQLRTRICIIGAGAAGLTLARELSGGNTDVIVLEGGGLSYSIESQSLYAGETTGRPYYNLDATRLRFLGGSTNHYAGDFAPLDGLDYVQRPGFPDTGWPISPQELEPYYRRAHAYCHLGPVNFEAGFWASNTGARQLPLDPSRFRTVIRQSSPTRFAIAYKQDIEASDKVALYLNASVSDIRFADLSNRIEHVVVKKPDASEFKVFADRFVLATGGLENPRILLNCSGQRPQGIGNQHDLVGRYFMEHIGVTSGLVVFADRQYDSTLYSLRRVSVERAVQDPQAPLSIRGFLCAHPDVVVNEGLANVRMSLSPIGASKRRSVGAQSARFALRDMAAFEKRGDWGDDFERAIDNLDAVAASALGVTPKDESHLLKPFTVIEQLPNPRSRVKLTSEKDRFGCNRIALDWHWTADDKRSVTFFQRMVAEEFGRAGIGRMRLDLDDDALSFGLPFVRGDRSGNSMRAGNHHIGTTRMSEDPRKGVVDTNCRVHTTDNLYIAGSSVFPTAGLWNPTLTIVALSLRLSDYLRRHSE